MVVDTDVHQGQGTAVCTSGDANIYTLSTHERNNYPARKETSSQDVELDPKTTDEVYLQKLQAALTKAISAAAENAAMTAAAMKPTTGPAMAHNAPTIRLAGR